MKQLILASQSPRRRSLLAQLGYQFNTQAANIDESVYCNEKPEDYVIRLAKEKALTVFLTLPEENKAQTLVLGSDTSVVIDGDILGKPNDEAECITTLMRLENKQHQVLTAIAIITQDLKGSPQNYHAITALVETKVHFKPLTVDEIKRYWNTGEPCDKAGSYAIQGIAGQFVTTINGSYSAVVGLPLYETSQLLAQAGLPSSINEGLI